MMNDVASAKLFIDLDHRQERKAGQAVCGDRFVSKRLPDGKGLVLALSDGLGSGVKANILSTMTAVMASKFAESGLEFPKAADTMMRALPVCSVRKIAYATFTIAVWNEDGLLRIVEAGNPAALYIRNGAELKLDAKVYSSDEWEGRTIRLSEVYPADGDRLLLFTDGVSQAGMGSEAHPTGWAKEDRLTFVLRALSPKPGISSRALSSFVIDKALSFEKGRLPHDDMTCVAAHFHSPRVLLMVAGPPFTKAKDPEWARTVAAWKGDKAVCGGSTAKILARELGLELHIDNARFAVDVPPAGSMEGFSIVTEGILTLTKAAQILEGRENPRPEDPANRLAILLRDHDAIEFLVGTKVNEAHQDPSMPTEIELRRAVVKRIESVLKERYLKDTKIRFV